MLNLPMRPAAAWFLAATVAAGALGACAGPRQVEEQPPTVTYEYRKGQLNKAREKAEAYCYDRYRLDAVLIDAESDEGYAVFACE